LLAREHRLTSSGDIRTVIRSGKRSSNKFVTLHYLPAETHQFAIVTSRAVGNAVVRNKLRRRTKAILRTLIETTPQVKGVFRYRPEANHLTFDELTASVTELLQRTKK